MSDPTIPDEAVRAVSAAWLTKALSEASIQRAADRLDLPPWFSDEHRREMA